MLSENILFFPLVTRTTAGVSHITAKNTTPMGPKQVNGTVESCGTLSVTEIDKLVIQSFAGLTLPETIFS